MSDIEPMTDEQLEGWAIARFANGMDEVPIYTDALRDFIAARDEQWQAAIAEQQPVMTYLGRHIMDCGEHGSHDMEMHKLIPAGTKLYALPPKAEPAPQGVQRLPAHCTAGYCPCVKCPYAGVATEASKPVQAEAPKELNRLLNEFAKACAFGDDLARRVAGEEIHEFFNRRATKQAEAPTASNAEREHFESTVVLDAGDEDADFRRNDDGRYTNYYLELAWNGWQARAALATQQEAQPAMEHSYCCYSCNHEWTDTRQPSDCPAEGCGTTNSPCATNPGPEQEAQPQAAKGIPTEDGIRWQSGNTWPDERKAVTVDGNTWYRHDHPKVAAQAEPAGGDKEDAIEAMKDAAAVLRACGIQLELADRLARAAQQATGERGC